MKRWFPLGGAVVLFNICRVSRAKYLKIFALCDAKLFYTGKLEIYCGKQPNGAYDMSSKLFNIVMRLIDHVTGSNRNLTCVNGYTIYPLAIKFLKK